MNKILLLKNHVAEGLLEYTVWTETLCDVHEAQGYECLKLADSVDIPRAQLPAIIYAEQFNADGVCIDLRFVARPKDLMITYQPNLKTRTWEIAGSEEKLWRVVRYKRDGLLQASDWTQAADIPESVRVKWSAWRTALRNLPQECVSVTMALAKVAEYEQNKPT